MSHTSRIKVFNGNSRDLMLWVEPWANEFVIAPNSELEIEFDGPEQGEVIVNYVEGGLQVRADVQTREGESKNGTYKDAKERLMDRDAIRRALVEHDLLLFSRRRLPLPINNAKSAEIR